MTPRKPNPYADGRGPKPLPIMEKLLRQSAAEGGCLIWTGGRDKDGYGKVWHEGKTLRAHRAAWVAANGLVPPGLSVLHHCDNSSCFRLEHLYLGTQADNMRDRVARGRWRGKHPKKERA